MAGSLYPRRMSIVALSDNFVVSSFDKERSLRYKAAANCSRSNTCILLSTTFWSIFSAFSFSARLFSDTRAKATVCPAAFAMALASSALVSASFCSAASSFSRLSAATASTRNPSWSLCRSIAWVRKNSLTGGDIFEWHLRRARARCSTMLACSSSPRRRRSAAIASMSSLLAAWLISRSACSAGISPARTSPPDRPPKKLPRSRWLTAAPWPQPSPRTALADSRSSTPSISSGWQPSSCSSSESSTR